MGPEQIYEAICESVTETCEMMLGAEVSIASKEEASSSSAEESHHVVVTIGLGCEHIEAAMNLLMNEEAAAHVVNLMLDESDPTPEMIQDGVGELANMVAGGTKTRTQENGLNFTLGLPSVITGSHIRLSHNEQASVDPFCFTIDNEFKVYGQFLTREVSEHRKALSSMSIGEKA